MIGSRKTPQPILDMMIDYASVLRSLGYTVRSGGALGADTAAEIGHTVECDGVTALVQAEIFIPWQGFGKTKQSDETHIKLDSLPMREYAFKMAQAVHPAWGRCSSAAKSLHARNSFQVLGKDLNDPSDFVICYAEVSSNGTPKGGTATAISIANEFNVPVYNLYKAHDMNNLNRLLLDLVSG